jgi:hypothetical protein
MPYLKHVYDSFKENSVLAVLVVNVLYTLTHCWKIFFFAGYLRVYDHTYVDVLGALGLDHLPAAASLLADCDCRSPFKFFFLIFLYNRTPNSYFLIICHCHLVLRKNNGPLTGVSIHICA